MGVLAPDLLFEAVEGSAGSSEDAEVQVNHERGVARLRDVFARRFRARVHRYEAGEDALLAYTDGALKLDERADVVGAKCWVGLFAEAVRHPALFAQVRRLIDAEMTAIKRRSQGRFTDHDAGCVLAFVIGALVIGAFAPRKTAGFAAPGLRKLVAALT